MANPSTPSATSPPRLLPRPAGFGMSLADYIARAAASGQPAPDEARRKRRIELVDITGNVAIGELYSTTRT